MIECYLTDKIGNILNPYEPGAIKYTLLPSLKSKAIKNSEYIVFVLIEGFLSVSVNNNMLTPFPFKAIKSFFINAPQRTDMNFSVKCFKLCFIPYFCENTDIINKIEIIINIVSLVNLTGNVDISVPSLSSYSLKADYTKICISAKKIYDSVCFKSKIDITYQFIVLKADVSQYNAVSESGKRVYTNADELTEYGDKGILSPNDVSYFSFFVNGVLQPETYYNIKKGYLEFITSDTPDKCEPITILFVTLKDNNNYKFNAENNQYFFFSDGVKKQFTDTDIINTNGDSSIPDSKEVSFYNLFVNGVLQPKVNYTIKKGILVLKTTDTPPKNTTIILETLIIKDESNRLIHADIYMYNARSNNNKSYTNSDELRQYGDKGILNPNCCSYYNLFTNGALQPEVNYSVHNGLMVLNTYDTPIKNCTVSLQFIIALL